MPTIYNWLIIIFWIVWALVWAILARVSKKVISRPDEGVQYFGAILFLLLFRLIPRRYNHPSFIPHTPEIQAVGTVLCAVGIAFAIWARIHIGKNWSSGPSVQEDHQLVTSGPYRLVRHPIYTGMLLALFGSAFISGSIGICIFIFVGLRFVWRVNTEEKIMIELFPQQYPEYKKRTKALIPFIW